MAMQAPVTNDHPGYVYLLHFDKPVNPQRPARHYLGWAKRSVEARVAKHKAGKGADLTRVAVERGVHFEIVRTWEGDRHLERQLRDRSNNPRLCPVCRAMQTEARNG